MVETATEVLRATNFRLIGVLPIIIFVARLIQYVQLDKPGWILASCHISNLMLGVGMIFDAPLLIRVAAIWLVIGLPMWIIDAIVSHELWWSSVYSHAGGFIIAIYAISKARTTGNSWLPATVWFVFLQMVARYTTAEKLNINISQFPYELVKGRFSSYWTFWPVLLIIIIAMVLAVELMLLKFFPVEATAPAG